MGLERPRHIKYIRMNIMSCLKSIDIQEMLRHSPYPESLKGINMGESDVTVLRNRTWL